jgi:hypothetical protein
MAVTVNVRTVSRLIDQIKPLLAGHDPAVQGAVLADLLAIWLSGHHPATVREHLLSMHILAVLDLVAESGSPR